MSSEQKRAAGYAQETRLKSRWRTLWIMWITLCITAFYWKSGICHVDNFRSTLWIVFVDSVDKQKTEHNFCANCWDCHKTASYV